jgi:hypothetical protein
MKAAVRTWGPIRDVHEVARGAERILAFQHIRNNIFTFVDISRRASAIRPTAISMGKDADHVSLTFYTVQGTPVADITRSASSVKVTAPSTAPTVEPDSIFPYVCFIGCIGRNITVQCLAACTACNPGEVITLPNCAYCGFCAGPKAIQCLVECGY